MNAFSVLLTSCLLGLCHCTGSRYPGNRLHIEVLDDYKEDEVVISHIADETRKGGSSGKRQIWDLADETAYEGSNGLSKDDLRSLSQSVVHPREPSPKPTNPPPAPQPDQKANTPVSQSFGQPITTTPITIDLASPDESKISVHEKDDNGITVKGYAPKEGYCLKEVHDLNVPIWKGTDKERGLQVLICYDGNDPISAVVSVLTQDGRYLHRCLRKTDGKWNRIKNEEHRVLMAGLREAVKPTTPRVLEINSHKLKNILINECGNNGVEHRLYYPDKGYHISSIEEGGALIWNGSENKKCIFAESYSKNNSHLISIEVTRAETLEPKFFEKSTSWREVKKEDYFRVLDEMRGLSL